MSFCFLDSDSGKLLDIQDTIPLKIEMSIESEVGDAQKQGKTRLWNGLTCTDRVTHPSLLVLKNVGKIERFITDQLKRLVNEEVVFPNFHCVDLTTTATS